MGRWSSFCFFFVVILVMSLAFRVSKIEVINASEYTDEEIIRASGVERGANLFLWTASRRRA